MLGKSILLSLAVGLSSASEAPDVHTRGWLEHARVMPNGLLMRAKLDSGAKTTSIHAEILPAARAGDSSPLEEMAELLGDVDMDVFAMLSGDAPDDPPEGEIAPILFRADSDQDRPNLVTEVDPST